MAIKDFNYMSQALLHPTTVKIILPENNDTKRTMYFLHGSLCDAKNCLDNMDMQKYSNKYGLAIVIPDCGNSFYIDHGPAFGNYGRFVGSELVHVTRKAFGFSDKRENTIIAGFSMGGYGAIRNGLKYSKNFGYIIAMSAAFLFEPSAYKLENTKFAYYKKNLFDNVFKEKSIPGEFSENYRYLIKEMLEKGKEIPGIYLSSGLEEDLKMLVDEFSDFLDENNIEYKYVTEHGEHDWKLWCNQIEPAINWCVEKSGVE